MTYFLSGDKIGLRAMIREDLLHYQQWLCDEDVTRYLEMAWCPHNETQLEGVYQESTNDPNAVVMVICDLESGRPVGTVGLYLIHWPCRRAQFRILLGDSGVFRKGFGTEATRLMVQYGFGQLNLETIYLGVNVENEWAIRAYEKNGFIREGRQRQFIFKEGNYYDCLNMSILRSEYEGNANSE